MSRYKGKNWGPFLILLAGFAACSGGSRFQAGGPPEGLLVQAASRRDLWDKIPAYGIVLLGESGRKMVEVNIEAGDSSRLRVGQRAEIVLSQGRPSVPGRVVRVLRAASAETGQSLAWIAPSRPKSLLTGQFAAAWIDVALKKNVIILPLSAVLIRDGKTYVVVQVRHQAAADYAPREVQTGLVSGDEVEIARGLAPGENILVQGGLGFLYADFKTETEN